VVGLIVSCARPAAGTPAASSPCEPHFAVVEVGSAVKLYDFSTSSRRLLGQTPAPAGLIAASLVAVGATAAVGTTMTSGGSATFAVIRFDFGTGTTSPIVSTGSFPPRIVAAPDGQVILDLGDGSYRGDPANWQPQKLSDREARAIDARAGGILFVNGTGPRLESYEIRRPNDVVRIVPEPGQASADARLDWRGSAVFTMWPSLPASTRLLRLDPQGSSVTAELPGNPLGFGNDRLLAAFVARDARAVRVQLIGGDAKGRVVELPNAGASDAADVIIAGRGVAVGIRTADSRQLFVFNNETDRPHEYAALRPIGAISACE
jgi:hypothetical protein